VTPGTRLPAHLPTLAESLREAGYKTFGVIGNPFAGAPGLGFDRGYDEFVLVYAMRSLRGKRAREKSTHFLVTLPADINGQVFSLLPRFERSRTFAHIHYLQPHKPYDPPAEFLEAFLSEGGEHGVAAQSWDRVHREFERANTTGETTQDVIATLEARYRANIRFVDEGIGELLERLRVDDLYDEAMIVLLSDHGDAFFKHRRFGHRKTLYDDMTRIPLLIKFPASDGIAPRRFPDLVETVDVLPTLLDRLCIPSIERMEGESLLPLVRGERNGLSGSEVLLATSSRRLLAIRRGDFKYIIHVQSEVEEIYDLRRDPDEQDNLAETHPELLRDLRRALEARVDLRSHSKRELEEKNLLRNDPEMNRLLNALGYTEGGDETDDH
jgi:arylsulfatase A-like enzyme